MQQSVIMILIRSIPRINSFSEHTQPVTVSLKQAKLITNMFCDTLYHFFSSCLLPGFNTDLIPGLPDDLALECFLRIPIYEFSKVASVCRSWRREISRPEFWRRRKAASLTTPVVVTAQAIVHRHSLVSFHYLFELAPLYRLTICDPERNCWLELPLIPGFLDGFSMSCRVVSVGLEVVVIGSRKYFNTVFIYNFLKGKWRQGADMPGKFRTSYGCASDSDHIVLVAGGHDYFGVLQSAMAYDVLKDEWIQLPHMEKTRHECQCVYRHGKFYVMGGYSYHRRSGPFEKNIEIFDVATWKWCQHEDFLMSTSYSGACVDGVDGTLYVCQNNEVIALEDDASSPVQIGASPNQQKTRNISSWRVVGWLPRELRSVYHLGAWHKKLVVFGNGGAAYVLDVNSKTWIKLDVSDEYSGHVVAGCCLVI